MAATLSLARGHEVVGDHWTCVGLGAFGAAVAARATATASATTLSSSPGEVVETARDCFATGRPAVVVTANSPESMLDEVDSLARAAGCPWLPIELQATLLNVGPLFLPGGGPCRRCFADRILQHTTHPETTAALRDRPPDALREDPGWLPHHAAAAAALLDAAILAGQPAPGHALTLQLDTMDVVTARVISCHGCPRCAVEPPALDDELRHALPAATSLR